MCDEVAEYYDLVAVERRRQLGPAVLAALSGIDPGADPLLDLGAGTGLVTAASADALPGVALVAVKPSCDADGPGRAADDARRPAGPERSSPSTSRPPRCRPASPGRRRS